MPRQVIEHTHLRYALPLDAGSGAVGAVIEDGEPLAPDEWEAVNGLLYRLSPARGGRVHWYAGRVEVLPAAAMPELPEGYTAAQL